MTQTPPPDAPRSPDGHYWWDGQTWQPVVPQPGGTPETGGPIQIGGTHVLADAPQQPRTGPFDEEDETTDGAPRQAGRPNRLIVLGGIALLLGLIAIFAMTRDGGDDDPVAADKPTASATATAKPSRTAAPAAQTKAIRSYLTAAAAAQKKYAAANDTYAKKPADLKGLKAPKGVTLKIISATSKRYCMQASARGKNVHYVDSATGKPSTKRCK